MDVDMNGEKEKDAFQIVFQDGRVQKVPSPRVVLLSRQRLYLQKIEMAF